jgi:hypothetical protein
VAAARITTPPAVVAPVFDAEAEAPGVRPRLQRLAPAAERRVAAHYPPNLPGCHGLEDAAAYNPLPPARFEEFFAAIEPDRAGKTNVTYGGAGVGPFHDPASLQHPLCDLFGIRFILTDVQLPASSGLVDRTPKDSGEFRLWERTTAMPRATFVTNAIVVPDRTERLALLARRDRDVRSEVVLEDPAAPAADGAPAAAKVAITVHADEFVVVSVETDAAGYLRLADPYDPGWIARVDGEPAKVLAADHYLRAVHVPAGRHQVVFEFAAPRVVWPLRGSAVALLAILVLLLWPPRRSFAA